MYKWDFAHGTQTQAMMNQSDSPIEFRVYSSENIAYNYILSHGSVIVKRIRIVAYHHMYMVQFVLYTRYGYSEIEHGPATCEKCL